MDHVKRKFEEREDSGKMATIMSVWGRESAQLGKYLAEMLCHSVKYRFEFIQNVNFVSKVETPCYTPTSMYKTFSCSIVFPNPCIFINVSNSNVCIVVGISFWLNLHFSI